uniref:Nuclear pore complex interacting protein N-terminal domain-containing protein n=1 Tax=Tetraodon nigroviridis TaxID=99883 RepID=H3DG50_TETNG
SSPEPEYSESVLRLTLLRDHFTQEKMEQIQKLLGLKNLFKLEAMFSDLDTELQATRRTHTGDTQDIENALETILETSENAILDEIERMLDGQETNPNYDQNLDSSDVDEETEILDDFQELAFSLRQKYSTVSDSTPLARDIAQGWLSRMLLLITVKNCNLSTQKTNEYDLHVKDEGHHVDQNDQAAVPEVEVVDNLTITEEEGPAKSKEEQSVLQEVHSTPDIIMEEDAKLTSYRSSIQRNRSLISVFSFSLWEQTISLLPEEWKPGETFFGCPWEAVIITALVGVMTFTVFFWKTVLAVKKKEYLVDEKKLTEQIQALKKEKEAALTKMSELQKQTDQLKENQKQSKEKVSSTMKIMQDLEKKLLEAKALNDNMIEEKNKYSQLLEEEKKTSLQNDAKIEKLEKANEKLQLGRKKIQEALAKTTVLLDEAKIREDARQVQHKCLEKEQVALKEENRKFKSTIKDWEDKHKELNNQIKVYQKAQKELEDAVVLKDHNVRSEITCLNVLSQLLADLDACDSQKDDSQVLANGEVALDKKTTIRNRIKQMVDVSRVQTTLTVVEEERDRFMTRLLNEEKARKTLEEQHQELEHELATLKRERGHVENQLKVLQQKNEIMVEMYQQKENALQQRLTKEELERRSKENMLSEVGGKALEAEEQVKVLRQRISEMEEQMRKTEEVYKEQIKDQENKTHSNWVNARNAERALNQEKLESSKLRENFLNLLLVSLPTNRLAVLTAQLNERRAPLFRPNSGQAAGPRQGDSYGPSPVSGGAPSPPPMIEGPRRPPSAPVGRRTDPFDFYGVLCLLGPRPPSEPLGRYPENKHMGGTSVIRSPPNSSPRTPTYMLGPGHVDPRGPLPPPPHFRPSPPLHFGPPPPGVRGPMGPRLPFPPDMRPPGPPMNLPPGVPPHLTHGNIYGQAPPDSLQYPAGAPSSPRQDRHLKQEGPQDSARPATVEP